MDHPKRPLQCQQHVGNKLEPWPDRWERLTGIRPNVVRVTAGGGTTGAQYWFVGPDGEALPIGKHMDLINRPVGYPGVCHSRRGRKKNMDRLNRARNAKHLLDLHFATEGEVPRET